MQQLLLGVRLLWRDWRGGELGLLIGALTVAVTIVVGIAQFVERINGAILAESNEFIAADRLLRSNKAIPDEWLQLANGYDLRHAQVLHFPTMVLAGDAMQLAAVKAVSAAYPLLGELTIQPGQQQTPQVVAHGPSIGEVWADARLMQVLGLEVGDKLAVGNAEFGVSAVVTREPDSGFSVFSYGPRLLMNSADIPATGVIQPGSRVQYNLLLQGGAASLDAYLEELKPQLGSNQRVLGVRDSQPTLARALDRAEGFLLLAGSMGVILAGIAIAIATRRYTERHFDYVAILRSLGATSKRVLSFYLTHLLLLSVLAVACGCLLGWGLQTIAVNTVSEVLRVNLPDAGGRPFVLGTATAIISFIAFALPAILHLQHVAPMRVLRRDLGSPDFNQRAIYLFGILGLVSIVYLYSGDAKITLALSAGVAGVAATVLFMTWLLLKSAKVTGMQAAHPVALALAGIRRRAAHSALQVFAFTLALMLLLVLLLVRTSLLEEWRLQMPANTPNHFLLNITPQQVDEVRSLLADAGIETAGLFPMVRGRISTINGVALADVTMLDEETRANYDREINLTWAEHLPTDNELIAGAWWQPDRGQQLSVEAGLAERLQLAVGDKVSFTVAERMLTANVSSIRALDWEQMRPNFL
ncbi:MAG: ABC transporter permease [Pseudomonadales bacterium]